MKDTLIAFYLDWTNNHLTLEQMAENYRLTVEYTAQLIDMGRVYYVES